MDDYSANSKKNELRYCLSCGITANMAHRKYCSVDCRQQLHGTLNRRSGLLRALQTRYATFYFTDMMVIMDVLPFGARRIFSFMLPREAGRKPVEDFRFMSDKLSAAWWSERSRTGKRYPATQQVFAMAGHQRESTHRVMAPERVLPAAKGARLIKLEAAELSTDPDKLKLQIKTEFRRQAKKHHPDVGGNNTMFRRIHEAYESLLEWAQDPTFITRRGFSDKWFYDGIANKWIQPLPKENEKK